MSINSGTANTRWSWSKEQQALREIRAWMWDARYTCIAGVCATAGVVEWLKDLQESEWAVDMPVPPECPVDDDAARHLQDHGDCIIPRALHGHRLKVAVEAARSFELRVPGTAAQWVRQDRVTFVGEEAGALSEARNLVRGVGGALERCSYYTLSSNHKVPVHCQLARYDGGQAAYRRHRDNRNDVSWWELGLMTYLIRTPERRRCVTAILYLSHHDEESPWHSLKDGGALRLHIGTEVADPEEAGGGVITVEPRGGDLLIFNSSLLHEVLPTDRAGRVALTSWVQGDRPAW